MGLPLGPTFANIFMGYWERIWLRDCPLAFKPIFYRRYIDDTFLLFKDKSHVTQFLNYLNSKHCSIKFTHECESNKQINFLDITVTRHDNSFQCSIYRKPTFTGLGTSFFSFTPLRFKITSIQTLIYRAYNVCTNYHSVHTEFEFLKKFFNSNGYPTLLINKHIRRFLSKIYDNKPTITFDVPKKPMYISLPFFGQQSEKMKIELNTILSKAFPYIDFRFILSNPHKIANFFHYKDRLPKSMSASLVYQFSCTLGSVPVSYIGSTKRHLYKRIAEHAGRSARTNKYTSNPTHSSIRQHASNCQCTITTNNFKILGIAHRESELRILESIHIHKKRPHLNDQQSAFPLLII